MSTSQDAAKQATGLAAAEMVESGMRLGLGTGSTTAYALKAIGRRVREEGLDVIGVPTSFASERLSHQVGIPLTSLDHLSGLDLAFDGADEVTPALDVIKGRGAAHSREKVVAAQAERFIVLADPSKLVDRLGVQAPVPVEILPMAIGPITRALEEMGGRVELRMGQRKDGPVVSDQGLWILDVTFDGGIPDPAHLDRTLCMMPGVLDHGLFLGMVAEVLVGQPEGGVRRMRAATQAG